MFVIFFQVLNFLNMTHIKDCSEFAFELISIPPIGDDDVARLEKDLTAAALEVVKILFEKMSISPSDVGVEHFLSDSVVENAFEHFFSNKVRQILGNINDVNPIYLIAKSELMESGRNQNLTEGTLKQEQIQTEGL